MASLVKTSNKHVTLTFPDVQQQTDGADCGLFVLAFAYTLCTGVIPEEITYVAISSMHLGHTILIAWWRKISNFPADAIMRVPSKPLLKTFKVYCLCCLPDIGDGMISTVSVWTFSLVLHSGGWRHLTLKVELCLMQWRKV